MNTIAAIPASHLRRVFLSMLDQILDYAPGVYVGATEEVKQIYGLYRQFPGSTLHKIEDPYHYWRIVRFLERERRWIRTHDEDGWTDFALTEAGVEAAVKYYGKRLWADTE